MSPRNPEPTRAAILAAASRLLEEGGIEAVTLRAVGEAAGVSRGAPYRHFADKAALLQQLAVQTLRQMAANVRAAADAAGADPGGTSTSGDPDPALLDGALAYVHYAVAHPNHYLLIFGDTPQIDPAPEAEAAADDAMRSIAELLERARDTSPAAVPVRERATVIWVTLHGIAQLHITGHLHEPRTLDGATRLDELVGIAVRALWAG